MNLISDDLAQMILDSLEGCFENNTVPNVAVTIAQSIHPESALTYLQGVRDALNLILYHDHIPFERQIPMGYLKFVARRVEVVREALKPEARGWKM